MTEEKIIDGNNSRRNWKFDTTISLPMIGVIIFQTLVFTWILATGSKTLADVVSAVAKNEVTAYTKVDAAREREFQMQVQKNMTDNLNELTRRITILEGQGQIRMTNKQP